MVSTGRFLRGINRRFVVSSSGFSSGDGAVAFGLRMPFVVIATVEASVEAKVSVVAVSVTALVSVSPTVVVELTFW